MTLFIHKDLGIEMQQDCFSHCARLKSVVPPAQRLRPDALLVGEVAQVLPAIAEKVLDG